MSYTFGGSSLFLTDDRMLYTSWNTPFALTPGMKESNSLTPKRTLNIKTNLSSMASLL